jgi:hypothetical protein
MLKAMDAQGNGCSRAMDAQGQWMLKGNGCLRQLNADEAPGGYQASDDKEAKYDHKADRT